MNKLCSYIFSISCYFILLLQPDVSHKLMTMCWPCDLDIWSFDL